MIRVSSDLYEQHIAQLLHELGIVKPPSRKPFPEAAELVSIGPDIYGRDQRLTPAAAHAWQSMRTAAEKEGIVLQAVSAFRSVAYQRGIIERKLAAGQKIEDILRVSAAPGFSEHHTGRTIDITTPGCKPLEEEFERTPAFAWLTRRAGEFGFTMSYPRNNPRGVIYEPWHWTFQEEKAEIGKRKSETC
jgi:zinc D-Ala-D-Ala carboxypeptidase